MRFRLLDTRLVGVALLLALAVGLRPADAQTKPSTRPAAPPRQFGAMPADPKPGDRLLDAYFRDRAAAIAKNSLADVITADDWNAKKGEYRRQLAEMLGLWPEPPRTDLKPVVTGTLDADAFTVEKLHFQSMPGLYVTGNLYVPKNLAGKKAPAILYVCGHSLVKDPKTGKQLGNKTGYQHHGAWFARNGYVCLTIDTIQLGEIAGVHHGLYRENMWWWVSRGYTPAGVEAWNSMRAIDYLQSRPEVDGGRIGMTGRSGGGAYTWWTAALDERVKVAVPVAGITDVHNHVVDGVVEGHCDCMYHVNAQRWDFAQVAALVAPRPMLIANTDKDPIFPLDGVQRLHADVRRVYRLLGADDKLGLLVTEGPHKDTQDLQVPALRWFNRFLKNDTGTVAGAATKEFEPTQLKVFDELPADERVTTVQDWFVPKADQPPVPDDAAAWAKQRDALLAGLRSQVFAAWPTGEQPPEVKEVFRRTVDGVELAGFDVTSQPNVPVRVYVSMAARLKRAPMMHFYVLDQADLAWSMSHYAAEFAEQLADLGPLPKMRDDRRATHKELLLHAGSAYVYVAVRGAGPTAWTGGEKRETNVRRRFWLMGESLDGMRVWDAVQALRAVKQFDRLKGAPAWMNGEGRMAGVAVYASLFEPGVERLYLYGLSPTHGQLPAGVAGAAPDLLNVLKVLDVATAVALAAERSRIHLFREPNDAPASVWLYPSAVSRAVGWGGDRIEVKDTGPKAWRQGL